MDHLQASLNQVTCMSGILIIGYLVLILYGSALLYITVYCLLQFQLFFAYRKSRSKRPLHPKFPNNSAWPFVTIQLPIYNEQYVVGRLIDNIVALNYPRDRFEIHILDDSTDQTLHYSIEKAEQYRKEGFTIRVIHRNDREGYKAGALKSAMSEARGEFIAIFDADFLPNPDFLRQTIPHFADPATGVVQTRWEHLNENYSVLTKLQALQLNVHFSIEQSGRQYSNYLLQFNGTAGVWRTSTIHDAGGWQADTLTEDLDLSYRAQLKGWKIVYLEDVGSPAELPAEMIGLKSQQFRWMKGGAENARKLLPAVWASRLSVSQKIHATGHLLASSIFIFILIAAIMSVPLLFVLEHLNFDPFILSISLLGLLSVIIIYYSANINGTMQPTGSRTKALVQFSIRFPLFLAFSMGLSLHNSMAVLQGYLGRKSAFVRTPKFNIRGISDTFRHTRYQSTKFPFTALIEGILGLCFVAAVIAGIQTGIYAFLIFHLLLAIGFTSISWFSFRHLRLK